MKKKKMRKCQQLKIKANKIDHQLKARAKKMTSNKNIKYQQLQTIVQPSTKWQRLRKKSSSRVDLSGPLPYKWICNKNVQHIFARLERGKLCMETYLKVSPLASLMKMISKGKSMNDADLCNKLSVLLSFDLILWRGRCKNRNLITKKSLETRNQTKEELQQKK